MINLIIDKLLNRLCNIHKLVEDESTLIVRGRNRIILHLTRDGLTYFKKYFRESEYYVERYTDNDMEFYKVSVIYFNERTKNIIVNKDFTNINETENLFTYGKAENIYKKSLYDIVKILIKEEKIDIDIDIFLEYLKLPINEKMLKLKKLNDLLTIFKGSFLLKTDKPIFIKANSIVNVSIPIPVQLTENVLMNIVNYNSLSKTFNIHLKHTVIVTQYDNVIMLTFSNENDNDYTLEIDSNIAKIFFTNNLIVQIE